MMKLKHLIESDEVAESLLKHYGFSKVEKGFFRASSNVIYWVVGDNTLYFLRYTTEDERTEEEICGELAMILHVRAHGIYANCPVKTKEGNYLIKENGYLAILFEGVKGTTLDDLALSAEIARGWGAELGKLHRLFMEYMKTHKVYRPDYHDRFIFIKEILKKMQKTEFLELADQLEEAFDCIIKTEENYGLCHYDFEMDNVFYEEESGRFSIIDFDDAMYHFYVIDLVKMLDNIEEEVSEDADGVKNAVIEGYTSKMPMPSKKELILSEQFITLLGYAKIAYCLSYPPKPEETPDWMEEIVVKLHNAMEQKQEILLGYINSLKKN